MSTAVPRLRKAAIAGVALVSLASVLACAGAGHGAGAIAGAGAGHDDGAAAHGFAPASADAAPVAGSSDAENEAAALLARLVAARGVSGREGPVADAVIAELRRIEPRWQPRIDSAGNVWLQLDAAPAHGALSEAALHAVAHAATTASATASTDGNAPIAFIAHLDEIGLVVTAIRDDGLLECRSLGGFHDHLYRATAIELVTVSGAVLPGIALPAAPRGVSSEVGAILPAEPFVLDLGAGSAAQVAALGVALGDTATVPKELLALGSHRVAGRSNDDRVGCAALLLALEELVADGAEKRLRRPVSFIWSTREEVGLEGADVAARTLRPVPSVVYAVDTFVTSDSPREDPHYALALLGKGPVLRALDNSSITPPSALEAVRAVAARHDIPLQIGTMGGGNDGSRFVPEGAIDCPLAWPQRNSHSRVETLDLRDLVELSRLIEALAREG